MPYVDFADLKSRVTIMQAAQMLALKLKQAGHQYRGPCPECNSGDDRALVVTPDCGLFYCFAGKTGGDLIKLVAHIKACTQNEAAQLLASQFGGLDAKPTLSTKAGQSEPRTESQDQKTELKPLTYLEPEHPAVQGLGISSETAKMFESGYAAKGVLRGRYAVPIHGNAGVLLAYVGIAVSQQQSPRLLFHNFDPGTAIFNAHRLNEGGDLTICCGPLQLIQAIENGISSDGVVSFLSEGIGEKQLEMLAALMREKKSARARLY